LQFLVTRSSENIAAKLDEGVLVIAGQREETAALWRRAIFYVPQI
jgi:hypothetical protein